MPGLIIPLVLPPASHPLGPHSVWLEMKGLHAHPTGLYTKGRGGILYPASLAHGQILQMLSLT